MEQIIAEIESYCREARIAETTFGKRANVGGDFVGRVRNGASCTYATVDKIRQYMRDNPAVPAPTPKHTTPPAGECAA